MGKEQDLLVAVKSGDLLLAHKLLSKVKCNKTSEYAANRGSGIVGFVSFLCSLVFWSGALGRECNCFHCEIEHR